MTTLNLGTWIRENVITLVLLVIAVVVLWAGKNGNISKVVTVIGCGLLGLVWLALATTGAGAAIGEWLVSQIRA